ncbi:hypothetical protein ACFLYF_01775 [Chloroflexota bacterium]
MLKQIYHVSTVCLLLVLLAILTATPALAFYARSGDNITVADGEVINDDLYIAGNIIVINGTVNGDVWAVGNEIRVNGKINGSLMAAGGTVTVNGEISHALRVAGGTLDIRGNVGGDVIAAGGTLGITSTARVGNDLVLGTGQAGIAGPVNGDVIGGAGEITFSNAVVGNVTLNVDNLTLFPTASIQGNLDYTSQNEADIQSGARVGGTTTHNIPPVSEEATASIGIWGRIIAFLMTLVLGIVIVLLAPRRMKAIVRAIRTRPWPSLGWGSVLLVVTPFAALMVSITVIGLPIGLIGMVLYTLAIYLTQLFIGLLIGHLIIDSFRGVESRAALVGALALGFVILTLLKLIPFAGFFIGLVAVLFGLGALLVSEKQLRAEAGDIPGGDIPPVP